MICLFNASARRGSILLFLYIRSIEALIFFLPNTCLADTFIISGIQ
nr:MAG TPA: hypothetical protein [Bacteriophage sp.]